MSRNVLLTVAEAKNAVIELLDAKPPILVEIRFPSRNSLVAREVGKFALSRCSSYHCCFAGAAGSSTLCRVLTATVSSRWRAPLGQVISTRSMALSPSPKWSVREDCDR